ncbi:MAG TPA: N-acetylmuramoyl-L-alanine amidase [Casimicrobiaceae bacterium]|nr:N-acetylmuramoyl-L-alanine amidase [Casimicrobiaceae bacterium]
MPERDRRRRAGRALIHVSLERRRAFRWLLLPAALPSLAWGAAARVASARLWPSREYTRLIIEAPAPIAHRLVTQREPPRVALELDGVDDPTELEVLPFRLQASDPYIAAIGLTVPVPGSVRLLLDLKTETQPQLFALAPVAGFGHRLVLDLYPLAPLDPLMAALEQRRAEESAGASAAPERPAPAGGDAKRAGRRKILVAIDPGHGGEDPGAIGRRGTYEKNVVLAIAKRLKGRIDAEPGMRATLTRDDDYYVPLAMRVRKAQAARADLFVSIHADAFRERSARGSSVFALSEHGATSAAAKWLAQKENAADLIGGVNLDSRDPVLARTLIDLSQTAQISDSLKVGRHVLDGIGTVNPLHRGAVEQAGFAVLKAPDIPSILVETAFISNPDEEQKLRSERHQAQFAQSIHDGIRRYFAGNPPLARGRSA